MTDPHNPDAAASVEDEADNVFLHLVWRGVPSPATRAEMARVLDVASVAASDQEHAAESYDRG